MAASKNSDDIKKIVTNKKTAKKTSKSKAASAAFSLEDALAVAKTRSGEQKETAAKKAAKEKEKKAIEQAEEKSERRVLGAASLSDILGYNPGSEKPAMQRKEVPAKYQKFYDILMELHDHVKTGLNLHTENTLKRSSKEDAGDLSSYGQHMADAGTDTFDRDFALSMVSNEQDALHEVEEAIDRIHKGTYGICEMTGKQIREERLMAVPFTRYSIETQKQLEKNHVHGGKQITGVFEEAGEDSTINFGDENPDA